MTAATETAPRRDYEWVEGWGMAVGSPNRVLRPRTTEQVAQSFELARDAGVSLALRGTGCSYGDASTNADGWVLDLTRMNRILGFDAETGVANLEGGATIGELWRHALPHGWWPKVVSGTMFPTLAGAASMNIHGKNNYRVGTIGDCIRSIDVLTPRGELRRASRDANADLFHAAIGGFGMLGAITRVELDTKRVHSGDVEVTGVSCHDLDEMMQRIDARTHACDYLVGWVDCFAGEDGLGRGLIHEARYLDPGEDPAPQRTLTIAHQELPDRIMGLFPKSQVWRILRLLNHDAGMRLLNTAKQAAGRLEGMRGPYRQSHAAFYFLLDFVPDWKWAYGRHERRGLIQFQSFVPKENALLVFRTILRRCQAAGIVSYLGVLKRHRPDPFWLTHSVDGWSLALDFKVTPENRERLFAHCATLTDLVVEAGGKHYFAKDLTLRPGDADRFLPADRLDAFAALKRELDPENLLQTDLARRVFGDRLR
ncbi:MAG: FAD-binding oxidoreductase [Planctomycetes bacterium]|nr:FAD-binding oxidoreductase [Planctomycetota bacterium]